MSTMRLKSARIGLAQALHPVGRLFAAPGDSPVERALNVLLTWQERARQRHALATLDDRMLRDIGLSRADVAGEVTKPFWCP